MAVEYHFSGTGIDSNTIFLSNATGPEYRLTIDSDGLLETSVSGTGPITPIPYVRTSGDSMTGPLNAPVISGTVVSGASIFDSGSRVITDVNSQSGPSVTLTTTDVAEGTNQYYTATKVSGVIATQAGNPNGLATLDGSGLVPSAQMPPIAITDTFVVADFNDLLSAPAKQIGDVGVVTSGNSYIVQSDPYTVSGNWVQLSTGGTITSVNGQAGPTVSLTTTDVPEGTNEYYTEAKVNANPVVSGNSLQIDQNTTNIATVSGVAAQNTIDIATNAGDIATVSGVAAQNTIDISTNATNIATVSGVAAQNTIDIATNAGDIATVSGVAAQNTIDIATVSGIAIGKVDKAGDTMTGTLNVPVLSGTIVSGNNISVSNEVTIKDLDVFDSVVNTEATAFISGGELTINADPTKFDIAAGFGHIIDNHTDTHDPTHTEISWPAMSGNTPSGLGTQGATNIGIDSGGNVVQSLTGFTLEELRDTIKVGGVVHPGGVIISASRSPVFSYNDPLNLFDLVDSIGPITRAGNIYSANGTNLYIDKSAGETFRYGANYETSAKIPNTTTDALSVSGTFFRTYRDGSGGFTTVSSNEIDPDNWDDGSGVLQTVPVNDWTIQRIFFFAGSDLTQVYYGQETYANQADAEAAIDSEVFTSADVSTGTLRSWLLVRRNASDLSSNSDARFITAGKFGAGAAGSASTATTTLQGAYDNSVDPEIVTDAIRDGLTVKEGAGVGLHLFQGRDSTDALGFYVTASGETYSNEINSPLISGTTISGNNIFDSGNRVVTSVNSQNGPSITLTTTDIAEGTNLYYTEDRVNANPVVSGNSLEIDQNIIDIAAVSGVAATAIQNGTSLGGGEPVFSSKNGTDLEFNSVSGLGIIEVTTVGNTILFSGSASSGEANTSSNLGFGEILAAPKSGVDLPFKTISGLSNIELTSDADTVYISGTINTTTQLPEGTNLYYTEARVNANPVVSGNSLQIDQNTADIITVSGLTVTNANNISTNASNIATVSGVAAQNTIDIATNAGNIATVSGVAATAVQSASNIGDGDNIFSSKNGTDLEFNTVSGVGNVSITVEGNTVVFSGTGDGNGDVVGPASATDDAIAVYDGTTGKLIKNSSAFVSDITDNATNIATVSGVAAQNTIDIATNAGDIATVSGVAAQNTIDIATNAGDIATVSGVAAQNTIDISTNASNIATVSGVAAQNTIDIATNAGDIATVSGVAAQNTIDISTNASNIATVSGVAATAVQNGTSLGGGEPVFSGKNGTNLEFNSVSGLGIIEVTTVGNTILFSGSSSSGEANTSSNLGDGVGLAAPKSGVDLPFYTVSGLGNVDVSLNGNVVEISGIGDGAGDVVGPASATDDAIAVYDGTTGKLIKNSTAFVSDITDNATNIATVSGVAAQNTIDIATNAGNIATVSGVAAQNTIDIATNASNIATVSGVAATAVQSASNIGGGVDIFSAKNGTDLEFNTVSGVGNITLTVEGNTVVFSGTGDGAGDVTAAANIADNSIVRGDGGAKGVQDSGWTISDTDVLTMGTTSNVTSIFSTVTTNEVNIAGGAALNDGSRVQLHGNGHATLSNIGRLYAGNTYPLEWNATEIFFPQVSQDDAADKVLAISGSSNIMRWVDKSTIGGEVNTASNLGGGIGIFNTKVGDDLQFNSVSGVGNITLTVEDNTVVFSGTGDGAGDVVGPASATDNAIAVYDGTTGKLIQNSAVTISGNAIYASEISGVNARGFVFAYDTTTQTVASADTFQDVTFDTNAEIDGWTHTVSTADFVCGVAGTFQLTYSATTNRNGNPSPTIEFRNRKNGTEIAGSQTSVNIVSTNVHQVIGTSVIFTASIGDTITLQMAGSNDNAEIDPIGTNADASPSVRMTISKL
jgi:hypothetical protein